MFNIQEYIIAEKEIKMLKVEILSMLVNAVLCKYGPKKWAKPDKSIFDKS